MSTISMRAIHISNGTLGLHVMFSWFDNTRPEGNQYQHKSMEENNKFVVSDLREQLNKLGVRWFITGMNESQFGVIGEIPEALNPLFDMAISDPDPIVAFSTPYEIVIQPHNQPANVQ